MTVPGELYGSCGNSKMDVMTFLFYSESTEGNSQRAGQYGLAGGEREGHSGAESDRIRSEGEAICGRDVRLKIDGSWLKCRPV